MTILIMLIMLIIYYNISLASVLYFVLGKSAHTGLSNARNVLKTFIADFIVSPTSYLVYLIPHTSLRHIHDARQV